MGDRKKFARPEMADAIRDRKSTRLNSSHSQISYAVFCLKKKKKKHNENNIENLIHDPQRDISHYIHTRYSHSVHLYMSVRSHDRGRLMALYEHRNAIAPS